MMVSGTPMEWDISGHGVLIEIGDMEEAASLVRSVSIEVGINFAEFHAEDVINSIDALRKLALEAKPVICYLHPGIWQDGEGVSKKYNSQSEIDASQLIEFRSSLKSLFIDRQGHQRIHLFFEGPFHSGLYKPSTCISSPGCWFSKKKGPMVYDFMIKNIDRFFNAF